VWATVRGNYGAKVAAAFDRLSVLDPSRVDGRILLLHGPPGTGKTTALRSLASAWRAWCSFEVVVDTERLFGNASYLMRVLLGNDDDEDDDDSRPSAQRWRMLVLEDCDEMLRADAKKATGQALSRLLNVTDGFLGQGLRIFVALTTNEPLAALHPAIARPGRCVGEVHVDRLTRTEAAKWLGTGGPAPAGDMTLAELFALTGDKGPVRAPEEVRSTGTYL
jgi:SpoVK/Ycf46/Vps4 family AAA+-type ATPase